MDWLRRRARDWYQRALKGQLPSDWEEIQVSERGRATAETARQ